jgi:hypothetical protein
VFTGLNASTTYNFAIWPYTNSGDDIDYKTDGTVPNADGTTLSLPKVFISEYIEGTSNNKAIEIFNGEGTNLDLSKLTVRLYSNGASSPTNTFTGPAGTFNTNTVYIIANASSNAEILAMSNTTHAVANFNGDDAIEIVYDNYTTDIFGTIGNDPGTGWAVAGTANATVDKTLLRKLTVTQGTSNWTTSAGTDANNSQWIIKDADYAKNLGGFATAWLGTSNEEWTTETNWDIESPTSNTNVLINNVTNSPSISVFTEIKALHLKTGSSLTIESDGSLTVSGTLTNNAGASGLVIESDANGTGSLINNTADVAATVKRYLTKYDDVNDSKFHFISSPVTEQPIFTDLTDFYRFSEINNYWIYRTSTGEPEAFGDVNFEVGRGYLVANVADITKQFSTGTLNTYPTDAPLVLNATHTAGKGNGWNLFGNPFPSAINWNTVAKGDGMDNALYYYDASIQNYRYFIQLAGETVAVGSGSQYIPAMQGFMVHAKSEGTKTITIDNDDRVHQAQTIFYKTNELASGVISLKVSAGEFEDMAIVHFSEGATNDFDGTYDAYKLFSYNQAVPQIYTLSGNNENLAINGLPVISENLQIPVFFKAGQPGSQLLTADVSQIAATVTLTDLKTNTVQKLSENPIYAFTSAEGDDPNRFLLHFGLVSVGEQLPTETLQAYAYNNRLYVNSSLEKASLSVYDVQGRLLLQRQINESGLQSVEMKVPAGVYIVRLQNTQQSKSVKIVVQ